MCFVFTGQGAQWYAVGLGLLHYQVYQFSLKNADQYLRSLGCDWSLLGKHSITGSSDTTPTNTLDELNSRDESSTRLADREGCERCS